MALDYAARYPGQVVADGAYPQGKARDISVPAIGDGTPWHSDLTRDYWGFLQALLKDGFIDPSQTPDSADVSQYLEAVNKLVRGDFVVSNWTEQSTPTGNVLRGGAYSPDDDTFVVVGDSATILTSPKGLVWTSQTASGSANFLDVTYSTTLGMFCAVGILGTIETSVDGGVTWVPQSAGGGSTEPFEAVTYSVPLGLFIAVGGNATVQTSPNGVDWTPQTIAGTSASFHGIAYSNSLGRMVVVGTTGNIFHSVNGIDWLPATGTSATTFNDVVFAERVGKFCAVGAAGAIHTSLDGIAWIREADLGTDLNSVTYLESLGQFVAVGAGSEIHTSIDATNWAKRTSQIAGSDQGAVFKSEALGVFVTTGESGELQTSLRV